MNLFLLLASDVLVFAGGVGAALTYLIWNEDGDERLSRLRGEEFVRIRIHDSVIRIEGSEISADQAERIGAAVKAAWEVHS